MSEIIETMARGTHGYAFRLLERKPNAYMDERKMREREPPKYASRPD